MSKKLLFNNVVIANEVFPPIGEYTIMEITALNKIYTSFDASDVTELYVDEVLTTPTDTVRFQGLGTHTIRFKGNVSRFDLIGSCTIKQLSPTTTTLFRLFGQKSGSGFNSTIGENFIFGNIYNDYITDIRQLFSFIELMGEQATITIEHLNLPNCTDAMHLFNRGQGKSNQPIETIIISNCIFNGGIRMWGAFADCKVKNIKIINSVIVTRNIANMLALDEKRNDDSYTSIPLAVDFTDTTFLNPKDSGIDISYIVRFRNIQEIDLSFIKGNISTMYGCFCGCRNLKRVNLRGLKVLPTTRTDEKCFEGVPSDCVVLVDKNFLFTEQDVGFTGTFTRV